MKNFVLIITIFLSFFSCKKQEGNVLQTQQKIIKNPVYNSKNQEVIDKEKIQIQLAEEMEWKEHEKEINRIEKEGKKIFIYNKKSGDFVFKLFCVEEKNETVKFRKIEVYDNDKLVQKLRTDSAFVYEKNQIQIGLKDDANFDGHKDLKLINWFGMHDETYHYYIYNPKTKKFNFNKSLSKIRNPDFDYSKKEIVSAFHDGPSPNSEVVYLWENGKAVLDHGYYCCNPTNGNYLKFHRENGKIIDEEVKSLE